MQMMELVQGAAAEVPGVRRRLRELVACESPTEDAAGVNRAAAMVAGWAAAIGGRARWHRQRGFGDVLELRFGGRGRHGEAERPVLLLGHLDTVWPVGTLRSMPWREAADEEGVARMYGPGVLDMKAGVVMALAALGLLRERGEPRPVTLLLNSEEEVGSPVSRAITERLARASAAVLVLEPAQGLACKTARKGVGQYGLAVEGVAAHSGVDFESGHSAVRELAYQIEVVSGFTDLARGLTVNVGVMAGGTRSNVVAGRARAEMDVRIARASDAGRVERMFGRLRVRDRGCTLTVTGGINRPPMERRAGTVKLYKRARRIAGEMGFVLDEAATGGGSDGNFTAALGVPTLDGLGAVGEGAHAAHESVVVEHLAPRTALLAGLIAGVSGE